MENTFFFFSSYKVYSYPFLPNLLNYYECPKNIREGYCLRINLLL